MEGVAVAVKSLEPGAARSAATDNAGVCEPCRCLGDPAALTHLQNRGVETEMPRVACEPGG
jgi:hypothetical protein